MSEQRKFYRRRMQSIGYLAGPDGEEKFLLREVSIKGFRAHFERDPGLQGHQAVQFRLPELNMKGIAIVKWVSPYARGGFRAGFEFSRVQQA